MLKTIETRWGLPALTGRDGAAPDVGDVLTLTTPRTDDPLANVTAPTSSGANPAVAEVSHIQTVDAQLTSQLPVPLGELHSAPLLANQQTPADFDNYVKTRTATWKTAKAQGHAPRGYGAGRARRSGGSMRCAIWTVTDFLGDQTLRSSYGQA